MPKMVAIKHPDHKKQEHVSLMVVETQGSHKGSSKQILKTI